MNKRGNGVHLRHCYQGEYENSCKYGDLDCPAKPMNKREKPEKKNDLHKNMQGEHIGFSDRIYGYNQACDEWEVYHEQEMADERLATWNTARQQYAFDLEMQDKRIKEMERLLNIYQDQSAANTHQRERIEYLEEQWDSEVEYSEKMIKKLEKEIEAWKNGAEINFEQGSERECGHFVRSILSFCPVCQSESELQAKIDEQEENIKWFKEKLDQKFDKDIEKLFGEVK